MSVQSGNTSAAGLLRGVIALPFEAAGHIALEPVATGLLLYGLIKAPADIRARLLRPLHDRGISAIHLYSLVTPLKYLLALGVVRRVHHALSRLADNYWHLRQQGEPWKFGDEKLSELVLITGGCSGFGALMTKGFVGKARVVILDIQDVPDDLAQREWDLCAICSTANDQNSARSLLLQMRYHRQRCCEDGGCFYPRATWQPQYPHQQCWFRYVSQVFMSSVSDEPPRWRRDHSRRFC